MLFISLSLGSWHFISFRLLSFYWLCTILESSYSLSCICVLSFCISQEFFILLELKEVSSDGLMSETGHNSLKYECTPPHTPFFECLDIVMRMYEILKILSWCFDKSFRKRLFVCFKWNEKSSWPFIKELRTSEFGKWIPPLLQVDWWGNWYFKIPLASKLYDCHIIELKNFSLLSKTSGNPAWRLKA